MPVLCIKLVKVEVRDISGDFIGESDQLNDCMRVSTGFFRLLLLVITKLNRFQMKVTRHSRSDVSESFS